MCINDVCQERSFHIFSCPTFRCHIKQAYNYSTLFMQLVMQNIRKTIFNVPIRKQYMPKRGRLYNIRYSIIYAPCLASLSLCGSVSIMETVMETPTTTTSLLAIPDCSNPLFLHLPCLLPFTFEVCFSGLFHSSTLPDAKKGVKLKQNFTFSSFSSFPAQAFFRDFAHPLKKFCLLRILQNPSSLSSLAGFTCCTQKLYVRILIPTKQKIYRSFQV